MRKKQKNRSLFPASSFSRNFGSAVGGHFFFFASEFECVAQLVSNHVSKFQIQTPKLGCDIAILSRSGPRARPSSYKPCYHETAAAIAELGERTINMTHYEILVRVL